jgi:hypothetical protein
LETSIAIRRESDAARGTRWQCRQTNGQAWWQQGKHDDNENHDYNDRESKEHYFEKFNNENALNIHLHIFDRIFA